MSRIAGVIGPAVSSASNVLRDLLQPMRREGSDVVVTLDDASPLASCGAVVPRSPHFAQTIWNEDRNVVCFVSGDAFRSTADLQELRSHGHSIVEADRTGLVHLYEEHGVDALSLLNGWFNGVLLDLRRRQAILFND